MNSATRRCRPLVRAALASLSLLVGYANLCCQSTRAQLEPVAESAGAPRIEIDAPGHDFGSLDSPAERSHTFLIRNSGTALLRILCVDGGCGCLTAEALPQEIPPGGEGALRAVLNPAGMRGKIAKTLRVLTNDPEQSALTLAITADSEPEFDVHPRWIDAGRFRHDVGVSFDLDIFASDPDMFQLQGFSTSNPLISAEAVPGREKALIKVTIKPGMPLGQFSEALTIRSNRLRAPEVTVNMYGWVDGDIAYFPQRINFGYYPAGNPPERALMMEMTISEGEIGDIGIEDTTGAVAAVVVTEAAGRRYRINLRVKPEFSAARLDGELVISTGYAKQPVIRLPVCGGSRDHEENQARKDRSRLPVNDGGLLLPAPIRQASGQ